MSKVPRLETSMFPSFGHDRPPLEPIDHRYMSQRQLYTIVLTPLEIRVHYPTHLMKMFNHQNTVNIINEVVRTLLPLKDDYEGFYTFQPWTITQDMTTFDSIHFRCNINALRTIEMQGAICFWLLGKDFRMSIFEFNIAMGFVDPDNIQTDSYHTTLLDIPSTRTTRGNKVFLQHTHRTIREQEEQPPSFVEARLSRIEAQLEMMETRVSTILDILQSHYPQHRQHH
ncbi:hypothetical protein PVK06_008603 [Gossypium arboreum]|uniref:Uncharacterized protein n=1 Tax=Gossypium arboreum TaxID=29729 RepID=A0ABR0QL37_GOSAR|nr:hypothetical protein PVK06_008603 [Gossypium arboreum]